jgi:large subunit ribosomal protein L10
MTREEKRLVVEELTDLLANSNTVYIADISDLTVEKSNNFRRVCFQKDISLRMVKNTLLRKAMENSGKDFSPLIDSILTGSSSVMTAESVNAPAKLIKDFRKKNTKPALKGAYVYESCYIGDNQLDVLASLKSKDELIADVVALLQSPAKNVIGALQGSAGQKIAGIVKTLSERS